MNTAWIVALSLVAAGSPGKEGAAPTPAAPGTEAWRLSLREAIRIGLDNSEVIRVVADGDTVRIARLDPDAQAEDFKAAMMAHVRSIEQQYWALSQQQIQLWSREAAVKLVEEFVRRERAEVEAGRGTAAGVAEAQQRLEGARLALVAATSDTITTERQLRNILGLPPVDSRRIVPATPPLEAKLEPDWETCLAMMLKNQPDIVRQREAVAKAEGQSRGARDAGKLPTPAGLPADAVAVFGTERAKVSPDRQRTSLAQVVHQATHTLARFFLEVDATYKQFQTAKRLRQAAQDRLEKARAYYEEGRAGFTIDKILDAVGQYADAIAQEAQYKASYNTSIAALEEAKGTLLATDGIEVVGPGPREAGTKAVGGFEPAPTARAGGALDLDIKPAAFPTPVAPAPPEAKPRGTAPGPDARAPKSATAAPGDRIIKYDLSFEGGPIPIQLKGTISLGPDARRAPDGH